MVKTCTDEKSIEFPRSPANEAYRPKPFAGRGILVKGSQCHQYVDTDPSGTSGWGLICKGGVEITHVPFPHGDFFKERNVSVLAEGAKIALNRQAQLNFQSTASAKHD